MHHNLIAYGLSLIFGVAGVSAAVHAADRYEQTYDKGLYAKDAELGYGLVRDARAVRSVKKVRGGQQIFEAVYTVDKGIRVSPREPDGTPVFFFGESFTFGEGVADGDTLPAQFARLSNKQTFNFGVSGYGPHQFLRMLEIGRPEDIVGNLKPRFAIYTLVPGHVDRAAGRSAWDKTGPYYEVRGDTVEFRGPFNSAVRGDRSASGDVGVTSRIGDFLRSFASTEEVDRRRVLGILTKARTLVEQKYGAPLLIVLWDKYPGMSAADLTRAAWFQTELKRLAFPVVVVSELTPPPVEKDFYIPLDGHPKAKAYEIIAAALVEYCNRPH